jgi:hypothetical protein
MAAQGDDRGRGKKLERAELRQARLERELRANLLKRKAQGRARKASAAPRKEGGQTGR